MTFACAAAPEPTAPRFALPRGACDTHAHVIGPFDRFPLAESRPYTPPPAPVEALVAMLDRMGLDRVVVAHVSAHGMDLRVTLDALSRLGERARGVALLPGDTTDTDLSTLHAAGIRGVRLSHAYGLDVGINERAIRRWAERVGPMGWHIAMWPQALDEFALLAQLAGRIEAPFVIDHLGNHAWQPSAGIAQRDFQSLKQLVADGHAWIKLSAPYRAAGGGAPWPDLLPYAEALVAAAPERVLWASDWPHVGLPLDGAMPASGHLLDWLPFLSNDASLTHAILVDNPAALYGFPPVVGSGGR